MRPGAVLLVAGVLAVGAPACGDDTGGAGAPVDTLTVTGAWSRSTPPGATNGVVYLTVTSPVDDAIVAVTVPPEIATAGELHETMTSGDDDGHHHGGDTEGTGDTTPEGAMTMEPVDEVVLPAGTPVTFEPGGLHIMLVGLVDRLAAGDTFRVQLQTRSGAQLTVDVVVSDNPPD